MRIQSFFLCLLFSVLFCSAAEFDLGRRGTLSLSVAEDWKVSSKILRRADGTSTGYDINFKPRNNAKAKCVLTIVETTNGAPNRAFLQKEVLRLTERYVAGSVERKANLKDFSLQSGIGVYALFTDASLVGKTPGNDDYKVVVMGQVQPADNLTGIVGLACDDADGPEFKAMMKIFNSMKIKAKRR